METSVIKKINQKNFQLFLEEEKVDSYITHTFNIMVDYTKPVEELVSEGGYYRSNDNINSGNFRLPKDGKKVEKNIALFYFGREISVDAKMARIDHEGYRSATAHEFLSLGIAHPEIQLQMEATVVTLGSICMLDGDIRTLGICGDALGRRLILGFLDDKNIYSMFACVSK